MLRKTSYVLLPLIASLAAGILVAYHNCFEPSRPVDRALIQAHGGSLVVVKGDGESEDRALEYFEFGAPAENATETVLLLHGALTTGQLWKIHDSWGKSHGVRIVAPTLPGWGLSETTPGHHDGATDGLHNAKSTRMTPKKWATNDALFLLRQLGISESNPVHLVGASLGSIYAAALASSPASRKSIRNVMLYVAFAPVSARGTHQDDAQQQQQPPPPLLPHDPLEGSQLAGFSQMRRTLGVRWARTIEKLLILPLLRTFMEGDVARSIGHQWEGLWRCTDDIYEDWDFDWRSMTTTIPSTTSSSPSPRVPLRKVIVVSATKDDMAPTHNQHVLHREIQGSTLVEYDGVHDEGIRNPTLMQTHMESLLISEQQSSLGTEKKQD